MCGPVTALLPALQAVAGIASAVGALGGGQKQQSYSPPVVTQDIPTIEPEKTSFDYPDEGKPPQFLQMSGSLTPLQARSMIATYGVSNEGSQWRDPETVSYYKNLALRSFVDPNTKAALDDAPLPIEEQYLTQVLGQTPRSPGTSGFLNALLRA